MKPDTAIFGYGEFSEDKLRKWMEKQISDRKELSVTIKRQENPEG